MTQLIDKSALVAEIEKLLDKGKYHNDYDCGFRDGNNAALYAIKGHINTLEVKEPTASDRGIAEEIITNLKRVKQDYHIDLTREMEWIRNKV